MSEPAPASSNVFTRGFLPGLIVGLLVGLAVGAIGPVFLDRGSDVPKVDPANRTSNAPRDRDERSEPAPVNPVDPSKPLDPNKPTPGASPAAPTPAPVPKP